MHAAASHSALAQRLVREIDGEVLFEVETDKVSNAVAAPASGVLAEIIVGEGASAAVGERLAVIREGA